MLKIFDTDNKQMRLTKTLPKVFKRDHTGEKNETQIRIPNFQNTMRRCIYLPGHY